MLVMFGAAWRFSDAGEVKTPVDIAGERIFVVDGDSFNVGIKKFRLDGIDAPELNQLCTGADGANWECGKAARAALEALLSLPDLKCSISVQDAYSRSVSKCAVHQTPDVGSAQVRAGMAISHEYYGSRTYGDEEDRAITARRGIWVGKFAPPSEWRKAHPTKADN